MDQMSVQVYSIGRRLIRPIFPVHKPCMVVLKSNEVVLRLRTHGFYYIFL